VSRGGVAEMTPLENLEGGSNGASGGDEYMSRWVDE
jgi:hypothetical protein